MTTIVTAAPTTIPLGIQDLSTRQLVPEAEALPTHLPKVYIYAEQGPLEPQLVGGEAANRIFGKKSFDLRMPWGNHATVLAKNVLAQGNQIMMQRIKPADATKPAAVRLSLDLLPTDLPEYERNDDGSIMLDLAGVPVTTGNTVAGFKAKWIVSPIGVDVDGVDLYGQATIGPGDQTDGVTQSVRYPIFEGAIASFGKYGTDRGLRLWAPSTKSNIPIDDRLVSAQKVFPFRMACVGRPDELTSPRIIETLSSEQFVNVVLKPDTIDRNTDAPLYAGDVFLNAYQELNHPTLPRQWGSFGKFKVYDDVVADVLDLLYAAELPFIDGFSDFTGVGDEKYAYNFVSGQTANGVPYKTFQLVSDATSVRLTENTNILALNGSDGTMNDSEFSKLVAIEVAEYANPNSVLQDTARYPESCMYDSGFELATKYAMGDLLAIRKDLAIFVGTAVAGAAPLTASQESALAIALKTRFQMYPESEYYGTHTVRAVIVGRSGVLLNSQYKKRLPLTHEVAVMFAKYMGASNRVWKSEAKPDANPNNIVSMFVDINVSFTSGPVRNKDWANGLNWVESFSTRSLYFPAIKTVYDNDTSILNSAITMMACVELQKVGFRAQRQYSGRSDLSDGQLVDRVNGFITEDTIGRFDGRYVIVPETYYTPADKARGFSWSNKIKLYGPNMKTVQTLSIEARRLEDLQAS